MNETSGQKKYVVEEVRNILIPEYDPSNAP